MLFRSKSSTVLVTTAVLSVAVACSVMAGRSSLSNASPATSGTLPVAPEVDVAQVIARQITEWQSYSGRLEAVEKVEVRPLVSGTLVAVHFQDGAFVKKGDLLFTVDPRPYAAEVDRASAQLAVAQTREAYTRKELVRAHQLVVGKTLSARDYDEAENAAGEAAAAVLAARATLESARLNLGFTQIRAPVTGRVSRAEITAGNIVSAGTSSPVLTTVMSLAPIYASFEVDEQTYLQYLQRAPGGQIPVLLGLAGEPGYSRQGKVVSIDNRLDPASGTIRIRAQFDNPANTLVPGLYARIELGGSEPHGAILVDDSAIGTDQEKKFVLVVDAANRAQYREIKTGSLQRGLRIITQGLQTGERIVVNGLQRVRPGTAIKPNIIPMPGTAMAASTAASADRPGDGV